MAPGHVIQDHGRAIAAYACERRRRCRARASDHWQADTSISTVIHCSLRRSTSAVGEPVRSRWSGKVVPLRRGVRRAARNS
jgi:hypothetical protein